MPRKSLLVKVSAGLDGFLKPILLAHDARHAHHPQLTAGYLPIRSGGKRQAMPCGSRIRKDLFSTGFRENRDEVGDAIELMEGDLRDLETCRKACEGVDIVSHQGAVPSVPRSMEHPQESFDANTVGTHNLLLAAREAGVRRFIFAIGVKRRRRRPKR